MEAEIKILKRIIKTNKDWLQESDVKVIDLISENNKLKSKIDNLEKDYELLKKEHSRLERIQNNSNELTISFVPNDYWVTRKIEEGKCDNVFKYEKNGGKKQ